jgi:hypothetical protein
MTDYPATGRGLKGLIVTPNDHSALRVTYGTGRLHFGPVNHIEIDYEIVEGGQNGSGVWPDDGSIRFRAGELTSQDHNGSLRFR